MKLRFVFSLTLIALWVTGPARAAEVLPAMVVKAPRPTSHDSTEFYLGNQFGYAAAPADLWQRDKLSGDFQADIQQIIHPGGHVPDPLNPAQAIHDAFVVGGRSTTKF